MRPVLLAAATIAAALGVAPPVGAADPSGASAPPAVDGRIHNYNVCNNVCGPVAAQNAMNVAAWMFRADGGWTLSLQELCISRFQALAEQLGVTGWFVASRQDVAGCPEDHLGRRWFGNGILHTGPAQDAGSWVLPTQRQGLVCESPTTECRTMICVKAVSAAGDIGSCTSHFDNRDDAVATGQANEFLFISVAWLGRDRWRWLTGDFNLTPGQLPGGYATWRDLVEGPTHPSSGPTQEIDYVWLDPDTAAVPPAVRPYCAPAASDHCWTKGDLGRRSLALE